jgi:hypothetical protein
MTADLLLGLLAFQAAAAVLLLVIFKLGNK